MKIRSRYLINGHPVLGTYGGTSLDELRLVKEVGMNLVFGGGELLDTTSERGKFCYEDGIKVMYGLAGHVYGRPPLAASIGPDETTILLLGEGALPGPAVTEIDGEQIHYERVEGATLVRCTRGYGGTRPVPHRAATFLFWPAPAEAEVARVKDSPNLFGYYVIDDSPGNALSALHGLYRVVKRHDTVHPVCGGYSGATTLHNFDADAADVIMVYYYPFLKTGYERTMNSWDTQWMLTAARKKKPGVPFFGIYQGFWGGYWNQQEPLTPAQIREQIEDFVREGASGILTFYIGADTSQKFYGWQVEEPLKREIQAINTEIRETGAMKIKPEPDSMKRARIQPEGFWERPRPVPGIVPAWYVVAPFDDPDRKLLGAVFPPESGIDLAASYPGKGRTIVWERQESQAGAIGLIELYGWMENCTAYATCTVTSPVDQDVQMRVSSDDDMVVWFDGQQVYRFEGARGVHLDTDIVPAHLKMGDTRILVKVYNRGGQWGFNFRFTDRDGRPLEGLTFSPTPDEA